ncbi:nucleoside deaminase [Flavitalea flava]
MNDEYYMQQALREAQKAFEEDEVPIGAVIVMGGKIIARGYNQTERLTDCTAHAEIIALTSAFNHLGSKYLPEASIYITIEPCLMCAGALYWSKISRVIFGAEDEKNGYRRGVLPYGQPGALTGDGLRQSIQSEISSWPFHPKTELVKGVLQEDCARLMKEFFKARR